MHSLPWLFRVFRLREGEFPLGSSQGVVFGFCGAVLAQDGLGGAEKKILL